MDFLISFKKDTLCYDIKNHILALVYFLNILAFQKHQIIEPFSNILPHLVQSILIMCGDVLQSCHDP